MTQAENRNITNLSGRTVRAGLSNRRSFTGGSGTLTFGPGATSAIIEIPALPDGVKGPAKTFTLQLSNPSSGATVIPARTFHVVTIRDTTQAGVIQWMPAAVTANENGGAVTLTIQRTGTNLAQDISVSYALDSINRGTATPDVDYTFAAGTVFQWNGMGQYLLNAIGTFDKNAITGWLIVSGFIVVLGNLVADLLYGVLDPRIRYE